MKLLIATPIYPPDIGGPATYAKILEDELPKLGVVVRLVSFHTVRHLPKGIAHVVYFLKLIRASFGVDVILALDPASVGLPAALVAMIFRKKFVVKIVGDYAWEQGSQRFGVADTLDEFVKKPNSAFLFSVRLLRFVQTFVANHANRILVPSHYLKGIVSAWGILPAHIIVVENAFDPLPLLPSKAIARTALQLSGTILLSAGRLVPWKGFETLIRLLPQLQQSFPDVVLYIAGSGPEQEHLEAVVQETDMSSSVHLLGSVPHHMLMQYVRAADCFVLNTGYEGLSHQLLEVLAVGTPIVTTNIGGNPELIKHDETGLLVPYDDASALKDAITRMLSNENDAMRMTQNGKEFVAAFTVKRMVDGTKEVLFSVEKE